MRPDRFWGGEGEVGGDDIHKDRDMVRPSRQESCAPVGPKGGCFLRGER
jgi:hypothetical protein